MTNSSTLIGPFAIDAVAITTLGTSFTAFVNMLLDSERVRAGVDGWHLRIDSQQFTSDGGVDAELVSDSETDWLPHGGSVWQFKGGPFGPAKCANELERASFARERLADGWSYVMAIGQQLGAREINRREVALRSRASKLGIELSTPEKIRVLDANALARWASEFTPIAVSGLFWGVGASVQAFDQWEQSIRHRKPWISNAANTSSRDRILHDLTDTEIIGVRIQDESGSGKTRLVMEAVRAEPWPRLVVYVPDRQNLGDDVFRYLLSQDRTTVLVIDECDARDHEKLMDSIPEGSHLKLITIGEPSSYPLLAPAISVGRLERAEIETVVSQEFPRLWPEALRIVAENCNQNIRFAKILATRISEDETGNIAALIRQGDIETFISATLEPGTSSFFFASLLALFERVGWEGDLSDQLMTLLDFADIDRSEADQVHRELESKDLLTRQGRFRSISPQPLAVVLAASAWRELGGRIVLELLPALDRDMTLSLLNRAAQLGSFEPARSVLERLMDESGPFGSLESIDDNDLSYFLMQLAIISPDLTLHSIERMIYEESVETLRSQVIARRGLVWTLEKLAWHSRNFTAAANCLLRLSEAENESYANNATGTWTALFGAALPATAASPQQRLEYLTNLSSSDNPFERIMGVRACAHAISKWESVTVSAEIQGGVLVEARGGVSNEAERGKYRGAAIEVLGAMSTDPASQVSTEAANVLIKSLHALIDDSFVGETYSNALVNLPIDAIPKLRRAIAHLQSMFTRVDPDVITVAAVAALAERLPALSKRDELLVLLETEPWEIEHGPLLNRLFELVENFITDGQRQIVIEMLKGAALPSSWFVGKAIALLPSEDRGDLRTDLIDAVDVNPGALRGYLAGLVESRGQSEVDTFLESQAIRQLQPQMALTLFASAPRTDATRARILTLAGELSVIEGSSRLMAWALSAGWDDQRKLLNEWIQRIETDKDYEVIVDWTEMVLGGPELENDQIDAIWKVVGLRGQFPAITGSRWDWSQLTLRLLSRYPIEIASLMFDLIHEGQIVLEVDSEAEILRRASELRPDEIWNTLSERLQQGDPRLSLTLRGWFLDSFPTDLITSWIGDSLDRARLVAELASAGSSAPSPIARFLITLFVGDEVISSSLSAEYVSGSWSGPMSNKFAQQIHELENWRISAEESPAVKNWAFELIQRLRQQRDHIVQWEEERGW